MSVSKKLVFSQPVDELSEVYRRKTSPTHTNFSKLDMLSGEVIRIGQRLVLVLEWPKSVHVLPRSSLLETDATVTAAEECLRNTSCFATDA